MTTTQKLAAELIGTFWLTFGGCGAAVLAAAFPEVGIGLLGVSLAFGLTVLTMAYAIGHVSGCHLNPAATVGLAVGLAVGGRFPASGIVPYVLAQVAGAVLGALVLYLIASGAAGFDAAASGFASNGYGEHSPGGYGLGAAFTAEVVLTAGFLFIIMGATHGRAPVGFAPIATGLALTLIHLVSIPVTNTSVNPALHGPRALRGRLGPGAALAVLARAADRRRPGRGALPRDQPRAGGARRGRRAQPGLSSAAAGPPTILAGGPPLTPACGSAPCGPRAPGRRGGPRAAPAPCSARAGCWTTPG